MDKDSEIRRLREYVQLYLRREIKGNVNEEKLRISLFSKKSFAKLRESKTDINQKFESKRNTKNIFSYARDKKRIKKIKEEIGRSYHSHRTEPYKIGEVLDDIHTEIYPIDGGYHAEVTRKSDNVTKTKMFREESEAEVWIRTTSLSLSQEFTQ